MYALNKRFGPYDQWTVDTFWTINELADEIAYLLEEGWYIGSITLVESK
jgi:hypothetical protein